MKLADLMLCLYLLASLAMGLSGCVTSKVCPASKEARLSMTLDLMQRYQCTDKQQVEGTIDSISEWKCKDKDELLQALEGDRRSPNRDDCLLIAKRLKDVLEEGPPSEWVCGQYKPNLNPGEPPLGALCENL